MSRIKTESKVATLIKSDLRAGEGTEGLSDQQKRELVLTELHDRLNDRKETSLRPGILAQWKPGLKNRTSPAYGEPVIVVAILNPPIFDDSFQSGSVYYREELSLVLGAIEDGDFVCLHVDLRRFQPYVSAETADPV